MVNKKKQGNGGSNKYKSYLCSFIGYIPKTYERVLY